MYIRLKQQSQVQLFLRHTLIGISLCSIGLFGSLRVEAQNFSFNHSAFLCTSPNRQVSHDAAQAFNNGWFLAISNFRSRYGEAMELLQKAQANNHPYARIALLYLQSKMLNQIFPYAENQFDLIPSLVGDDPVGITLSAQVIAASTDFLSRTKQNTDRLIKALDRAIASGYVPASYVKGRILMMLDQNDQGIELIRVAAEKGNALAKHHLASLVINNMVKMPRENAVSLLESSVQDGDFSSLEDLAFCYESGFGVSRNPEKAMDLYEKGMKNGDSGAALAFGRLLLQLDEPDYTNAFIALNFAYNNGKKEAANALGYLYMTGLGVKQNKKHGLSLMEQAAQAGDINAIQNVIICYSDGNGITPDKHKVAMYQERLVRLAPSQTQYAVQSTTEFKDK